MNGVRKTQKITRAMKMVAAAKLRRAQSSVLAARPFARTLRTILVHLMRSADGPMPDVVMGREVRTLGLLVFTADRGLCGGFNSNVARAAVQHLETTYRGWVQEGRVRLFCLGKKGNDFFTKRQYTVAGRFLSVPTQPAYDYVQPLTQMLVEGYRSGTFDRVEIVYNEFKSVSQQRIVIEPFLPLSSVTPEEFPRLPEPIYEPSRQEILQAVIPRYLQYEIWRALLESRAAEEAARMAAMENATENASELISMLQLQYNKARQASITKELLEVVGGAEALSQAE
jgi:F-type H+-transporting ATPase subunit gamma